MIEFPQAGGCLCGDVRYRLLEDPVTLYACHCTDCQIQSGSSFVLSMWVPRAALELVRGELRQYEVELSDGRPKRAHYCGRCITRVWNHPYAMPDLAVLRPGTLDDTSWVRPVAHIFTRSAQPWVRIPEDSLRFEAEPEGDEIVDLARAWKNRPAARARTRA